MENISCVEKVDRVELVGLEATNIIKAIGIIEHIENQIAFQKKCIGSHLRSIDEGGNKDLHSILISDREGEIYQLESEANNRKENLEMCYGYDYDNKCYIEKFDSESFIKEMETLESVDEAPLSYEDYEEEMEQITERELRGDI